MATSTIKNRCIICDKEKASFRCEGCLQTFCNKHCNDHRQELSKQLDEIEVKLLVIYFDKHSMNKLSTHKNIP